MKTIILGDTHFGVRNNSLIWLKHQIQGLDEVIRYIRSIKDSTSSIRVIHCGDLFDSRSSLNPIVAQRVQDKLTELASVVSNVYILGGNHDYYHSEDIDGNVSVMTFLDLPSNVERVIDEVQYIGDEVALVPYFKFLNVDTIRYVVSRNPKYIYTHADLAHLDPSVGSIISEYDGVIITGHIHTPDLCDRRYTVGSLYPLTFADSNTTRGFYVLNEPLTSLEYHPLISPIRFWRISDPMSFDLSQLRAWDRVELYIHHKSYSYESVRARIKDISKTCDTNIILIPDTNTTCSGDVMSRDIESIIRSSIPAHLRDIFQEIESYSEQDV